MQVLTLNSGSSSVKFALIDPETETASIEGVVEAIGTPEMRLTLGKQTTEMANGDYQKAMEAIAEAIGSPQLAGIGHRVVHGGERFADSQRITPEVIEGIRACTPLAPLHNPANLLGIEMAGHLFGDVPQVAVFDTAFHQTLPEHAYLYAVPYELYEQRQVRRYGFHGISHAYVTKQAERLFGAKRCVSCHLGNGCSLAAVAGGKSLDTTMGLTPLEGLMMGTRSGDIDPGLFSYLGGSIDTITDMLNRESGLLGISGVGMDMRQLETDGSKRSRLAIEMFCYRVAKGIMAMSVPLGEVDMVIFTAGIGEHAKGVHKRVLELLPGYTYGPHGGRLTPEGTPLAAVIPTNEAAMIAAETVRCLA